MNHLQCSAKIKPEHLARRAIVYLRQSSEKQVRQNLESQRLQYEMAERVRGLGWHEIEIIHTDLDCSAAMASASREGFERVLSSVALGEVGIVASREVSRLSRTDKDWCRLVEVCQMFGTLYRRRATGLRLESAGRSTCFGNQRDFECCRIESSAAAITGGAGIESTSWRAVQEASCWVCARRNRQSSVPPDRRVCEAIRLVFSKFRELWSVRQTFQWFRDHDVELPANPISGTRLVWKIPSQSLVADILRNPFYAGAYVWGRRPTEMLLVDGRLKKRQGANRPPEQCRVFIADHHVAYIDWASYEENQRMTRRNSINREADESMAAIRAGQGLLVGLLRCGHCGRKLHVRYWGGKGTHARYLCKGDFDDGGQYCIGFGGSLVDRRFSEEVLKAISSLGVKTSLEGDLRSERR